MKRANRRRLVGSCCRLLTPLLLLAPIVVSAQEKAAAKKRPHTDSRTPFVHRIPVRDAQDIPISGPKESKDGKPPQVPVMAVNTTCGKCHDYPAISKGWHFNMADPNVDAGRPGEPWILTDDGVVEDPKLPPLNTRTQLPISYRKWPGTWLPSQVGGMNDWKFAYAFGRQHPGGGILETSKDARFNVTGALNNDCLVCHLGDNSYDLQARYEQIVKKQNFKYASLVAAGVGSAERTREKMKDNWTAADGPSEPPFEYDLSRFNPQGKITFDITRQVPNERCYSCHTSLDTGLPGGNGLAQRWRHDRDIHLVKGMLCVDCHKHGLDHMVTRGYEKEAEHRKDPTITTLTCQGCHYGASGPTGEGSTIQPTSARPTTQPLAGGEASGSGVPGALDLGGRNAAPRPIHKGLPTLHFERLSCTACHSGPYPSAETTRVLTSMAHRLGTESYERAPDALPAIQEPVFLRDPETHKITPHKVLYPTFWGRMNGNQITPISPEMLNVKALQKVLGFRAELQAAKPLTDEEASKVLDVIAGMEAPKAAAAATTTPVTTTPAPAQPWYTGEPVFVTGGKAFKRDGKGKVTPFDHDAAKPYFWALGHDVRGAQQALGAKGCTDCHASGTPIFDSKLMLVALLSSESAAPGQTMSQLRGDSTGALAAFAMTYPLRPGLIATGYTCAVILGLLLLTYIGRALGAVSRRRVP